MLRLSGALFDEHSTSRQERKHPLMSHSQASLDVFLLAPKPVQARFTVGNLSSDGGLLLLALLDHQVGLTERVAGCLREWRMSERVKHSLLDLLRQYVYQIACGYKDWHPEGTRCRHAAQRPRSEVGAGTRSVEQGRPGQPAGAVAAGADGERG
jgi:hypothetical protein